MHVDLPRATTVEVKISHDGRRLWIDTNKGNVLRIYNIDKLILHDERKNGHEKDSEGEE